MCLRDTGGLIHPVNDYYDQPVSNRAAQVVISMGDFARGLKLLKSSASLDPECPIPYVNAARAYLGMNDLVAARRQVFFLQHTLCAPEALYNRLFTATHSWNHCLGPGMSYAWSCRLL